MDKEKLRKIMEGIMYACNTLEHLVELLQQELDKAKEGGENNDD